MTCSCPKLSGSVSGAMETNLLSGSIVCSEVNVSYAEKELYHSLGYYNLQNFSFINDIGM